MSTPRTPEDESLRIVPLAVFALILIIPFLNFQFTFYASTLKLFVFQTVAAFVLCYALWEWSEGRLRRAERPVWWVFAPAGAWVAWGLLAAAWSPQPWLGWDWVVRGAWGLAGAVALAVILRGRAERSMFLAAASAVAAVVAAYMALRYGAVKAGFFGDVDLSGREVAAAFLLVPTLIAVAVLYRRAGERRGGDYRTVIWTAIVLVVLLVAGLRTRSTAWFYALGVGLAVVVGMMLPRWRLAVPVLLVVVFLAAGSREARQRLLAQDYRVPSRATRQAVLDEADWGVVGASSFWRLLVGNGVGRYFMALDAQRPPRTYAVSRGDTILGHARRQLTEVLYERGIVGVALALACGVVCVVMGGLVLRRARDGLDAAAGAGAAGGVVALGVFACFSSGAVGFGASMLLWVVLGLVGALSAGGGRAAALSWSREEELGRREGGPRTSLWHGCAALAGGIIVVALWWGLAAKPFWAEYLLSDGQAELDAVRRLAAQEEATARTVRQIKLALAQQGPALQKAIGAAELTAKAAATAHQKAVDDGANPSRLKVLAEDQTKAEQTLKKMRAAARREEVMGAETLRRANESLADTAEELRESGRRVQAALSRACTLSLGGRVWLNSQIKWALADSARGNTPAAADRYRRLDALCGPAFDIDILRAACYARLGRPIEAHQLYRRYARKNPFGTASTLFTPRSPYYGPWLMVIGRTRQSKDDAPEWRAMAEDFIAAASAAIQLDPDQYAMLHLRGGMHAEIGKDEVLAAAAQRAVKDTQKARLHDETAKAEFARSRRDMEASARIIERHLATARNPVRRVNLYFDLASANLLWNKPRALKAAKQVFAENIDRKDPVYRDALMRAAQIIRRLEPPEKKPGEKPAKEGAKDKAAPKGTERPGKQ